MHFNAVEGSLALKHNRIVGGALKGKSETEKLD
jgi:hypothetical protein